jgi:hypothetical protein
MSRRSAQTQSRRINPVGLNHFVQGAKTDDVGVRKLGTLVHAQIMAGDLRFALLSDADFGPIFATG